MRIWHQSYSDLRELPGYVQWLTRHAADVLPDVTVDFHGLRPTGATAMTAEGKTLALVSAATHAEAAGYDAFVLGCIYDPALAECRNAVNIPVLALAEEATKLRTERDNPLGLLVLAPEEIDIVTRLMTSYGLSSDDVKVAVVLPEISESDLDAAGRGNDWRTADASASTENTLTASGYTTVVAAEGVLNEYLWAARQDGVVTSIVDSVGWLWKQTQALIDAEPRNQEDAPATRPLPNDGSTQWFAVAAD